MRKIPRWLSIQAFDSSEIHNSRSPAIQFFGHSEANLTEKEVSQEENPLLPGKVYHASGRLLPLKDKS